MLLQQNNPLLVAAKFKFIGWTASYMNSFASTWWGYGHGANHVSLALRTLWQGSCSEVFYTFGCDVYPVVCHAMHPCSNLGQHGSAMFYSCIVWEPPENIQLQQTISCKFKVYAQKCAYLSCLNCIWGRGWGGGCWSWSFQDHPIQCYIQITM